MNTKPVGRSKKMDNTSSSLPLNLFQVQKRHLTINRIHIFIHSLTIFALIYYRVSSLFNSIPPISIFPWLLITASELLLSFIWVLGQAYRWRPVTRTVFPERLPKDEKLPPIDVFICTADPMKEPTVGVMNTVISAMSLDYPTDKLSVYVSDDAGAPITLFALREAFKFAKSWIPFCKCYGIQTRCPEAYFSDDDEHESISTPNKFMAHREEIKKKYIIFKQSVEKAKANATESYSSSADRPPVIEVIRDNESDEEEKNRGTMPLLVYVSREKRRPCPHHFKAGALNVLFRVSAIISNAPYILALDCDMYCNDPTSARQAMCFHLDPLLSPSLAFVQFPQDFHNLSKNDIYNGQLLTCFKVFWPGMDGLNGPVLSGTGFYLKREPLFRRSTKEDLDLLSDKQYFGPSDEFIASLHRSNDKSNVINRDEDIKFLASCTYEKDTQWGEQIGFLYHCVVEDYFTGFCNLHCKGWNSVYLNPSRPAFLGSVTTSLNDNLVQTTRWNSGLLQVGFSRFCPLIYGPLRMSILQSMCYAYLAIKALSSLSVLCYAIIPQLCLFKGIPLYPKVSDPWFSVFAIPYISSHIQYLRETISIGGSFKNWWYEHRMSMIRSVTAYFLACLDVLMKWIGVKEINFLPTNKAVNEEEVERYNNDLLDFQATTIFLLLLTTIVNLNIAFLVFGLKRAIIDATYNEMFGQICLSLIVLILSYPIIGGMIIRKDKGRIPPSVTLLSVAFVTIVLSLEFYY